MMLSRENLLEVLKNESLHQQFSGSGYLRIPNRCRNQKLIEDYLQQTFCRSSRYNPEGQPTIYLANSQDTLCREIKKNASSSIFIINHNHFRYKEFSISLSKVLNLNYESIQNQLSTNLDELIPSKRNFLKKELSSTQILGKIAKEVSYEGLIVPVDRNSQRNYYIVIFLDNLSSKLRRELLT